MSPFQGARNFQVNGGVFNDIKGDYYMIQQGAKDEGREIVDFYSRLSQNFQNEPYFSFRQEQNLRKVVNGTCNWLLSNGAFVQWRSRPSPSPILWVHGSPGSGKSILCSRAVDSLKKSHPCVVAYHFCDFARRYKPIEILSMLTCQILDQTDMMFPAIPHALISLASTQLKKEETVRHLINHLIVSCPDPVYFILDGLDEELEANQTRWQEGIVPVLQFLISLVKEFPDHVRLWVSSQDRDEIKEQFASYQEIDITAHAKQDVLFYLSKEVPRIKGPEGPEQAEILRNLQDRAECSFIWAKLMVDDLKRRSSLGSMKDLVKEGFPESLDEYYRGIFDRIAQYLRPLAAKVFSLIVFARRPLRFQELWEAIWSLESKSKDELLVDDRPYKAHMYAVFQPCIELVPCSTDANGSDDEHICRLIHSTLRDFLLKNPNVFCVPSGPSLDSHICHMHPIYACLSYLSLSRYSTLLTKQEGKWVDAKQDPVDGQRFLVYAAKYWDKHLDDTDPKNREEVTPAIVSFITSPNFWTCVQVQSLWVESQFAVFHYTGQEDGHRYLRRVFPSWFVQETEPGKKLWSQYRQFLHEWKFFLSCGNCHRSSKCRVIPHIGDLRHIWTKSLGSSHFLANCNNLCNSFSFANRDTNSDIRYAFDCIRDSGREVLIVQLTANDLSDTPAPASRSTTIDCRCMTWRLSTSGPKLFKEQTITVLASSCNLDLYLDNPSDPFSHSNGITPATFGPNGQTLRLGTKIFRRNNDGDFVAIPLLHDREDRRTAYVEDVAIRDNFLVLTSRTKPTLKGGGDALEDAINQDYAVADDDDDDSIEPTSDLDTDSDEDLVQADDSASEGSSVYAEDLAFDDDMINPWADYHLGSDDSGDEGGQFVGYGESFVMEDSDSDEEEETEPGTFCRNLFREEDDEDWNELSSYISDKKPTKVKKSKASISIFDLKSNPPTLLFARKFPLKCKIYGSPPEFHPTKSLLAWPLADGDVVFVDFVNRTSFVRRLRPSTSYTRHIFMKCHFSDCGQFMHIAALEAQRPDATAVKTDPDSLPPIKLAMLVSTYRLSNRKTTRSPPSLIYRMRIKVGETTRLFASRGPCTVTWTATDVYVTVSGSILEVYRVPLFSAVEQIKSEDDAPLEDTQPVWMPLKPVFLPETSMAREVYYFPELANGKDEGKDLPARIIIGHNTDEITTAHVTNEKQVNLGSKRLRIFHPPVGRYVDEETGFGGWVDSCARTKITENLGVGVLDNRMEGLERFNPDDDCDLEPYYY